MISKTKALILGLFFTNEKSSFYTGEIGRALGKKPGTFQRDLESLVKEGVLESEYRANARYFKLNEDFPFYYEYKSIISKTTGAAGAIKNRMKGINGIRYAFIFGSYASGSENVMSDIDLFIIGGPDEDNLIKIINGLENSLKREINYKIMTADAFKKSIKAKDPFIQNVYDGKKIMIEGDAHELRGAFEGKPGKKTNTGF